jgi:transcriptional regulator GlxA family with amidase domain
MTRVGILLFDGAEELDFVGPWEVYTMAAQGAAMGDDTMAVFTVSETGETVTCAKGMRVLPDHGFANAPAIDVLVVPGGEGTRREADNRPLLDWIARTAEGCTWVTSVCTGSLLLALAGPAAGKRVTTHWSFVEALRKRGCAGEVLTGTRYVRDGHVVTSAGVSAGIDMSLWVLGQMTSPAFARQVQHYMEYDPAPPYAADV